jgi:hypothetical protein
MATDPPDPQVSACPSCGAEFLGDFCRQCGERRLGPHDRSIQHYLDAAADLLTHFDSKGYRSLRFLVTRPGFLSVEQLRGSRVRYAKPLALFVSINVFYYLSITLLGANTFTTPLDIQLHQNNYYSGLAVRQVDDRIHAEQQTFASFESRYNERTSVLSKTLIFLFIPMYAVIFYGLFHFRRRYFVEHAVVATHLWCFILLLLAVVVPLIALMSMWWLEAPSIAAVLRAHDGPMTLFLQVCVALYIASMLRRVYATNAWYCAGVALLIGWSFFHIVWLYRYLLFEITLLSL